MIINYRKRKPLTESDKKKIVQLYNEGLSVLSIQERFAVSHTAVYDILKEWKEK